MTQPGTSTTQRATGRPTVQSFAGLGNFMAWTGNNPSGAASNWLNLSFQASGYTFASNPAQADSSNYGPALVVNSLGTQAGLFWTDAATSGVFCTLAAPKTTGGSDWAIGTGYKAVPGAVATGGPTAALGLLSGQLIVNVIWQDKTLNSMALWQSDILGGQSGDAPVALGQSCIDSPTLVATGSLNYLAYFDTNKAFNLAIANRGGTNFNFAGRFTTTAISSSFAPAFVLLNNQLAYVIWSTSNAVAYQQIGINAQGNWEINTAAGCSGTIAAPPSAGPSAKLIQTVIDGVTTNQILIAWAQSGTSPANLVYTTTITPSYTPVYNNLVAGMAVE